MPPPPSSPHLPALLSLHLHLHHNRLCLVTSVLHPSPFDEFPASFYLKSSTSPLLISLPYLKPCTSHPLPYTSLNSTSSTLSILVIQSLSSPLLPLCLPHYALCMTTATSYSKLLTPIEQPLYYSGYVNSLCLITSLKPIPPSPYFFDFFSFPLWMTHYCLPPPSPLASLPGNLPQTRQVRPQEDPPLKCYYLPLPLPQDVGTPPLPISPMSSASSPSPCSPILTHKLSPNGSTYSLSSPTSDASLAPAPSAPLPQAVLGALKRLRDDRDTSHTVDASTDRPPKASRS